MGGLPDPGGDWLPLGDNPARGVRKFMRLRSDGKMEVLVQHYRTEALIEQNKAELSLADPLGRSGKAWLRKVASVPPNIAGEYLLPALREGDDRAASRWLNDADHRAFRTSEGKV